jgi:plastocyanin
MISRSRRLLLCGVFAVVLAAGAGCGSSTPSTPSTPGPTPAGPASPPGSSPASATSVTVNVKNFAFNPQKVTIKVGGTVTWKFDDSAQHTATALDKSFNSPPLNNGQTFQHTFTKAGTYNYMCSIHQFMTGTVIVQ